MSATIVESSKIFGKYEILSELGRGGFATVYQARDTSLDRAVALKILHPYWNEDASFIDRFSKEARIAAGLRHENIVTIYETGKVGGQLYIAMEYLDGRTLAAVLTSGGSLSLEQALPILTQTAKAIDYAHGRGLIHRDIKPSNIILETTDERERAVLMDFGLVKAIVESVMLTTPGTLLGSPEYMSPEQTDPNRANEVGPASDRYAFGVVAYHILTGRVPFPGSSISTLHAHESKPVPPPRAINPQLPETAANTLVRMLAKNPDSRFPSADAFVTQLRADFRHVQITRRREALLSELYSDIQIASKGNDWGKVLAFGEEIQAVAPNYLDVPKLMLQAHRQLNVSTKKKLPKESRKQENETWAGQSFSRVSAAFILTLIMLLLVLSAAIFFLFQGRQELEGALQSSNEEIRTLGQQQAVLELEKSAAQSTIESLDVLQATALFENTDLMEQLVNSNQIRATLEARGEQPASGLDNANATINAYESQAPIVNVVEPEAGATIIVGQPVELVIVASDIAGIKAVNFSIGTELFGGPVDGVQQSVTVREVWVPQTEGSFTLAVTAVNNNGILNEAFSTDFTVIPVATSTPEPSATPEPTPVPASP